MARREDPDAMRARLVALIHAGHSQREIARREGIGMRELQRRLDALGIREGRRRRITPKEGTAIARMIRNGRSVTQIATALGRQTPAIWRVAGEMGLREALEANRRGPGRWRKHNKPVGRAKGLRVRSQDGAHWVSDGGRMVSSIYETRAEAEAALEQIASRRQRRKCLVCRSEFLSEGPHNRLCDRCAKREDPLGDYRVAL